jgi:hypothetical protein
MWQADESWARELEGTAHCVDLRRVFDPIEPAIGRKTVASPFQILAR